MDNAVSVVVGVARLVCQYIQPCHTSFHLTAPNLFQSFPPKIRRVFTPVFRFPFPDFVGIFILGQPAFGALQEFEERFIAGRQHELGIGVFFANPGPVSYTHLDVYKRQLRRASSPPWP